MTRTSLEGLTDVFLVKTLNHPSPSLDVKLQECQKFRHSLHHVSFILLYVTLPQLHGFLLCLLYLSLVLGPRWSLE